MLTGHFLFFTPFSVMVILEYPSILAVSEIPRPLNRFVCVCIQLYVWAHCDIEE